MFRLKDKTSLKSLSFIKYFKAISINVVSFLFYKVFIGGKDCMGLLYAIIFEVKPSGGEIIFIFDSI